MARTSVLRRSTIAEGGTLMGLDGASSPAISLCRISVELISSIGAGYHIGVDGISLVLVLLTTLLTSISILASFGPITTRVK